ncbi:MAG TPA: ABC transporter ATP-binding protein [Acidimicrobiia bacterium]|nr:ABC transporter ATP-binding protein [Acidimicrobiia bacterium]
MYARFGGTENKVDRPLALLRRAARYGKDLARPALLAMLATLLATVSRVAEPLVIRRGVDDGVIAGDLATLTIAAVVYLALLGLQYVFGRWSLQSVGSVAERYLRGLRVRVFAHLMSLDIPYFSRSKAGVLVSRMTSDIDALTQFASEGAFSVVSSVLTVLGVGAAMFFVDSTLALVVMALLPLLALATVVFRRFADRAYQQVREQIGQVLATLQEAIAGVRVVQAYTQEEGQATRFGRVNRSYYEANIAAARAISTYFPAIDFIRTLGIALVLLVGGLRVADGQMSFGSLVAFLLYLNWFFEPLVQLSNVYNLLQAALAALSKLFGLLDEQPEVSEAEKAVPLPESGAGELTFEEVTFGYDPAAPVLHQVDLTVRAGTRLAVVGETGAGKSTLAKLAIRFYDPLAGRVRLDGSDLRSVTFESLRRRIAFVPQEGFIFRGSLRENIAFARPDIDDERIWEVCETLGIDEWVRQLPERLDTELRERGSRLSSGERQLVALARALAASPALVVLDEATSNLDPGTEEQVERAFQALLEDRTSMVIAHRLQTAQRADQVVVVDEGRIVEHGTPEELVAQGGAYARLANVWALSEERSGARW